MTSLLRITTVQQLSDRLNVPEKKLRGWLRSEYPERAPGQGDQWLLTPAMNRRMAIRAKVEVED